MIKLNSNTYHLTSNPGIYFILNTVSGRGYIGQSIKINKRIREHRSALKNDRNGCIQLQYAFNKYGIDVFVVMVLEELEDNEFLSYNLTLCEQFWMDQFHPKWLYNTATVAGSNTGIVPSIEARHKMSIAKIGKPRPPITDEHRANLSEANKNPSEEIRATLSAAQIARRERERAAGIFYKPPSTKGRKASEEEKKKRSEAAKKSYDIAFANGTQWNPVNVWTGRKHREESKRKQSESRKNSEAVKEAQRKTQIEQSKRPGYGTSLKNGKYEAHARVDGKRKYLGRFVTQKEAHDLVINTQFPDGVPAS